MTTKSKATKAVAIPFRFHPRVFRALGADLVTNDIVAIIELVKNAYDAYATRVRLRFGTDEAGLRYLEISDNGVGMNRETVTGAWLTVATPFREQNPQAKRRGKPARRATGEKGLGRLSAARLGDTLEMYTQAKGEPSLKVVVDWNSLAQAESIASCTASVSEQTESPVDPHGTLLKIFPLKADWDQTQFEELRENLARLLPPFTEIDAFQIELLDDQTLYYEEAATVSLPTFLMYPKYKLSGSVDDKGTINWKYIFHAIQERGSRRASGKLYWDQIRDVGRKSKNPRLEALPAPGCGPFAFEIRAWDIGPDDTEEIANKYGYSKSRIRKDIRAFKGLSLYRDGVLVLPKSENSRDWLGLDLKRVGRVGHHLSTTQIVGYVSISADLNPEIEDTSDREGLVSSIEVLAFEELLRGIVGILAKERAQDRTEKKRKMVELFGQLSAKELLDKVNQVAQEGGTVEEAASLVQEFSQGLDETRDDLQQRFAYYSRLAGVGTIAEFLVHEVRGRTTFIGEALTSVWTTFNAWSESIQVPGIVKRKLKSAEDAVEALERLADSFAPLASRSFRRRRNSRLRDVISGCLTYLETEIRERGIVVDVEGDQGLELAVDPGELHIVLANLLANATYWLLETEKSERRILIRIVPEGNDRVTLEVHDSGPGVPLEQAEWIFGPGNTKKHDGIGMGLTVAGELIGEHGGVLRLDSYSPLQGASFSFDLPLVPKKEP